MTLPFWTIPALLTAAIVCAACFWPIRSPGGGYNFGAAFEAALHVGLGVIAILVVWLIYFMVF